MFFFLVVLFVIGGINWYLVFNERARRRWGWSSQYFFQKRSEDREIADGMAIAGSLIAAVICSTLIVVALIVGVIGWFK